MKRIFLKGTLPGAGIMLGVASLFGVMALVLGATPVEAEAELSHLDPYSPAGWYEVIDTPAGAIRWNPTSAQSWILACPGVTKTCDWDPIDFRDESPIPIPGGWYDVLATDHNAILWNIRTGQSWVLACPGATKSCDWDPIDVRGLVTTGAAE